jgi:hypothetical protein
MIDLVQRTVQTGQSLSDQPVALTTGGWIFITIAWTTIISMAVFCYRKILQKAAEKRQRQLLHSPSLTQKANPAKKL